MIPRDFEVFAILRNGGYVDSFCAGRSMEPVYFDRDPIRIFGFNEDKAHPEVGDVVHFWDGRGFNRHQVADIFRAANGVTWYRLEMGMGDHDQFVERNDIVGWVVPHEMIEEGLTPASTYGTIEEQREEHKARLAAEKKFTQNSSWEAAVRRNGG